MKHLIVKNILVTILFVVMFGYCFHGGANGFLSLVFSTVISSMFVYLAFPSLGNRVKETFEIESVFPRESLPQVKYILFWIGIVTSIAITWIVFITILYLSDLGDVKSWWIAVGFDLSVMWGLDIFYVKFNFLQDSDFKLL